MQESLQLYSWLDNIESSFSIICSSSFQRTAALSLTCLSQPHNALYWTFYVTFCNRHAQSVTIIHCQLQCLIMCLMLQVMHILMYPIFLEKKTTVFATALKILGIDLKPKGVPFPHTIGPSISYLTDDMASTSDVKSC